MSAWRLIWCCGSVFSLLLTGLLAGGKKDGREQGNQLLVRVAALGNPDSPEGLGYKFFKEELERSSQGSIKVELYLSGQLGDYKSMINELRSGEFEVTQSGAPSWLVPEAEILGAPYLVRNREHFIKVMNSSAFGKAIIAQLEAKGLKVIAFLSSGTRVTSANRLINSIEDMAGLKIRVPSDDFLLAYARQVGANPTPIAFQEVYLALQTNQVEAQENPLATIKAMKFYEVQKCIAMTNHYIGLGFLYYSLILWNKLTEEQQQLLGEVATDFAQKSYQLFESDTASLEQFFTNQGLTVTHPDLQPFRKAMQPYYASLSNRFNSDAVAAISAIPG